MSVEAILGCVPAVEWLASNEAEAQLADPALRLELYGALHRHVGASDAALLRVLLAHEVQYRAEDDRHDGEYFENLYWCALLLYEVGDVQDVLRLWRAKHTNFDTGCGFDGQFLLGAGLVRTLEHLEQLSAVSPEAQRALDYLNAWAPSGELSAQALDDWLERRLAYFD